MGEGGYQKDLEQLTHKLKMEGSVHFLGFVGEKRKRSLISDLDVFVFPTRWNLEGFGVVLIEAMMLGTPVVTSNYGPIPEVVKDAAYLVKPLPKEIAKGIEKIATDSKLKGTLIKKGRERAKELDIKKIAKIYEKLIYD